MKVTEICFQIMVPLDECKLCCWSELKLTIANVDSLRDEHGQRRHPFTAARPIWLVAVTVPGRPEEMVPGTSPETEVLSTKSHLHFDYLRGRNVKKQNFNNQMFQSQLPSGCGLRINGRFNDHVQPWSNQSSFINLLEFDSARPSTAAPLLLS